MKTQLSVAMVVSKASFAKFPVTTYCIYASADCYEWTVFFKIQHIWSVSRQMNIITNIVSAITNRIYISRANSQVIAVFDPT